jgi:hypothetical protein
MFDTAMPTNRLDARPVRSSDRRSQVRLPGIRPTGVAAAMLLALVACAGKAMTNDAHAAKAVGAQSVNEPEPSSVREGDARGHAVKPVIWCFVGSRDEAISVETALRSRRITHVAIFAGNRVTSDTLQRPQTQAAIEAAKRAGVQLILVRYLWQTQPGLHSGVETLTNSDYYVGEIARLREEAERIGAPLVGLDTEAYGPTPLNKHFRSGELTEEHLKEIGAAAARATDRAGQVDFVLPAGSGRRFHPYLALARMGKQRISEDTYYDNAGRIAGIRYPYEIAGMYMNVVKTNDTHPHLPFFLPTEVFGEKRNVWQEKEGLMIWPREGRSLEVANALLEASRE